MNSCLYEGWVRHRRCRPVVNEFRYRLFYVYLDLAELDDVFRGRLFWSTKRPALAWFRRADHVGDPAVPLGRTIRDLVLRSTGRGPAGPICLLTHLRHFGYVMNPVSFYYCFDETGRSVETIVAEVHNTPWGETHCYVLTERECETPSPNRLFRFAKNFHVSPFMTMNQTYRWRFGQPDENLHVHMENWEDDGRLFDATLQLEKVPITTRSLAAALANYPFMTAKVVGAIYGQALKLWWKGCPFFPHPKHGETLELESR